MKIESSKLFVNKQLNWRVFLCVTYDFLTQWGFVYLEQTAMHAAKTTVISMNYLGIFLLLFTI